MKTPKRTCRDCLFFTAYSSADPDGRCGEGCGTYGTHTKGSEAACNAFMLSSAAKSARWKRKKRIAQLKRTISRLNAAFTAERKQLNALWLGDHLKRYSPEWDAFMQLRRLKTPADGATADEKFEYWIALREVGKSALNAACLAAMAYGEAKATAENGQQTARKEHNNG